jgi:hypothetical protein
VQEVSSLDGNSGNVYWFQQDCPLDWSSVVSVDLSDQLWNILISPRCIEISSPWKSPSGIQITEWRNSCMSDMTLERPEYFILLLPHVLLPEGDFIFLSDLQGPWEIILTQNSYLFWIWHLPLKG